MMVLRVTDETPGADALALDALEIMHSDSLHGPGILYRWMADGNHDAMSMIFEVASVLANDVGLNARYFFEYKNGQPRESRVIEKPGYDFRHTGDNLPTVTP